ncbi:MAG: purine-nucleoside phosphorylase [Ignavibacteriales bacterium]|nr:purine-nucleoside phosphorylase [Ignavibacteriales bacterium]
MNGQHLEESARFIESKTRLRPSIALILGSGLGDFADELHQESLINSADIPHYPFSTVQGHAGQLAFGRIENRKKKSKPILVFKGRVHFYESGNLESALYPVRLARKLGAKVLFVTNAAGGINKKFHAGDLMLLRDIISLAFLMPRDSRVRTKKVPPSASNLDLRALSQSAVTRSSYFDVKLQNLLRSSAKKSSLRLQEGTYCWLRGPTYETAAEIRMLSLLGADAVGMSTVPEVVMAKKLGMRVAAVSLISNLATGISHQKLSHQEVTETANAVKESFTHLLRRAILSA